MEIEKTLVISTSHLPESLGQDMHERGGLVCHNYNYGYLLQYTTIDNITEFDLSLGELGCIRVIMILCAECKCDWVRFDCDGPVTDELEVFDW